MAHVTQLIVVDVPSTVGLGAEAAPSGMYKICISIYAYRSQTKSGNVDPLDKSPLTQVKEFLLHSCVLLPGLLMLIAFGYYLRTRWITFACHCWPMFRRLCFSTSKKFSAQLRLRRSSVVRYSAQPMFARLHFDCRPCSASVKNQECAVCFPIVRLSLG